MSCTCQIQNNVCEESHTDSNSHHHGSEVNFSQKNAVLLAISIGLFAIAFLPFHKYIQFGLYVLSVLSAGYELLFHGFKNIFQLNFQEETLMTIAVAAAFAIGDYPEACLVTILYNIGEALQGYAVARSRRNVERLTEIRPDTARILNEKGEAVEVDARTVETGAKILVRAGDRVPLDCVVMKGSSTIDSSALTGESVPVYVEKGDSLLSGSINTSGILTCEVVENFESSTASQIVKMVYESSAMKGKTENFISKFSKVYTPIVVGLAVLIALLPPLLGLGGYSRWIHSALIFLVASCPCALIISVPLSYFAAIGALSKKGVLVKGSKYVETLSKINVVAFDKTGTLTSGKLDVDQVVPLQGYSKKRVCSLAYSLEKLSAHPIAQAVVRSAAGGEEIEVSNVSEIAGLGMKGIAGGKQILCGSAKLLKKEGFDTGNLPFANLYICEENNIIGYITLKEHVPAFNENVIPALRGAGVQRLVMLTGDNARSAKAIAAQLGIEEYHGELYPKDKVQWVEQLKREGNTVAFVGDGINDAPVLASADLGISMGLGSEIANVSSDMVLMNNKLPTLSDAIQLSKKGMRIVRQNIVIALAVKLIVLVLGVMVQLPMAFAVFADTGVALLAVLNAMRTSRSKEEKPVYSGIQVQSEI